MALRPRPSRSRPSEPDQGPGERSPGPFAALAGRSVARSPTRQRHDGLIQNDEPPRPERLDRRPSGVKRALRGAATVAAGSAVASPARLGHRASLPRSGSPAA